MDCKEALKRLKQETCPCTYNPDFDKDECLKVLENALNQAEENENFFKIIFKNLYWARWFRWAQECKTCEEYNNIFVENAPTRLTQAEFDLVKKVVEKYAKKD